MDVTSLLNVGAAGASAGKMASVEQASAQGLTSDSSPTFSPPADVFPESSPGEEASGSAHCRTPWDAGGYSLPLTINTKAAQDGLLTSMRPATGDVELSVDATPRSPRHQFSDSRSSLSSHATVLSSSSSFQGHSRISSLSTVSEYQPLCNFSSEGAMHSGRRTTVVDSLLSCPTVVEVPPSPLPRLDQPLETASSIGSRRTSLGRSLSGGIIFGVNDYSDNIRSSLSQSSQGFLRPDSPPQYPSSRSHKRAVSAPDIALDADSSADIQFGPVAELTPPRSPSSSAERQPVTYFGNAKPSLSRTASISSSLTQIHRGYSEPPELRCLAVANCTTGSQLRKAISHIFGRNKLCTKSIPSHVWVHWCRKHYQRIRYRNADAYAKQQCVLVIEQIDKVQEWSSANEASGQRGEGVLRHWTLQARKREAKRLQERKRRHDDGEEDEDDGNDYSNASNGAPIPQWLQGSLDRSYNTEEIRVIVLDIQHRMETGEINQIPDIEILPDITADSNDATRPRMASRRNTSRGPGHRHTRSELPRAMPHSMFAPNFAFGGISNESKRQRTESNGYDLIDSPLTYQATVSAQMPYSQTYDGFSQSAFAAGLGQGPNDTRQWIGQMPYRQSPQVLPAPTPRRLSAQTMAQQLESHTNGLVAPNRRPQHARSISETPFQFGGMNGASTAFRARPSGLYAAQGQPTYAQGNEYALNYSQPMQSGFEYAATGQPDAYMPAQVQRSATMDASGQYYGMQPQDQFLEAPRAHQGFHSRGQSVSSVMDQSSHRPLLSNAGPGYLGSVGGGMATSGYTARSQMWAGQ